VTVQSGITGGEKGRVVKRRKRKRKNPNREGGRRSNSE